MITVKIAVFCMILILVGTPELYSNGINLSNVGPRAGGMGGAFVGIADDYTAVIWNPAGLYQLNVPVIGAFVSDPIPFASYTVRAADNPAGTAINAKSNLTQYINPNLMGYAPLIKGDLTVGLGMYFPSGLGIDWNGNDLKGLTGDSAFTWMSKIAILTISPAISYKINNIFSVGAAMNINYGSFDTKKPILDQFNLMSVAYKQYSESSSGWGYGATFGVLAKLSENLQVGLSTKLKSTIKFSGSAQNDVFSVLGANETHSDFTRDMSTPFWLGGGISWKPTERLLLSADIHRSPKILW